MKSLISRFLRFSLKRPPLNEPIPLISFPLSINLNNSFNLSHIVNSNRFFFSIGVINTSAVVSDGINFKSSAKQMKIYLFRISCANRIASIRSILSEEYSNSLISINLVSEKSW